MEDKEGKMELEFVKLENGIDYAIIETLIVNNNKYFILANENDEEDVTIRKVIIEDGKECMIKLDNEEEFNNVMLAFINNKADK